MNKLNKQYIPEHIDKRLEFNGFIVFEDTWITEYHILVDSKTNKEYNILDYKIYEEYIMEGNHGLTLSSRLVKRSAVKLDKSVTKDQLFYTKSV